MKRKITAVITALFICLSPLCAEMNVSAYSSKDYYENGVKHFEKAEYERAAAIAGVEYDAELAAKVASYRLKTSDKIVKYKNSLAKKALDRIYARADAINRGDADAIKEGFFNAAAGKDYVVCEGRKGGKTMQIVDYGMAYYLEKGKVTSATLDNGEKLTRVCSTAEYKHLLSERVLKKGTEIPDDLRAYVYTFSHKGEKYTLEMFLSPSSAAGFLTNSGGELAGMYSPDELGGFRSCVVSFSPEDKLFKVPSELKEVETPYTAAKDLLGISYDYKLEDFALKVKQLDKKYKPSSEISYSASLTKKFIGKLNKRVSAGKDYLYAEYNDDAVNIYARSGKSSLAFTGGRGYDDPQLFISGKTVYGIYAVGQTKEKYSVTSDEYNELLELTFPCRDITGADGKVRVYRFRYGGKPYTYELFDKGAYTFGFLFDESGSPVGRYGSDGFVFIRFKNSPDASLFKNIASYKTVGGQ